jgi:hypothetical protein
MDLIVEVYPNDSDDDDEGNVDTMNPYDEEIDDSRIREVIKMIPAMLLVEGFVMTMIAFVLLTQLCSRLLLLSSHFLKSS